MTRKPLTYLAAIMAVYAIVVFTWPDMFGLPVVIRSMINVAMIIVIIASGILMIKEWME